MAWLRRRGSAAGVVITINSTAVHILYRSYELDFGSRIPIDLELFYEENFYADQLQFESEGCQNLLFSLQGYIVGLDDPDGEELRQQVLDQWLLAIKEYVEAQCDISKCSSWTICVDAGMTCAGKRRLFNALTSAAYRDFRIMYKCTAMALTHLYCSLHSDSGPGMAKRTYEPHVPSCSKHVIDHDILVLRVLENGNQTLARFSVTYGGVRMLSINHCKDSRVFENMIAIEISRTDNPASPLKKVIFTSELPIDQYTSDYVQSVRAQIKSALAKEVLFETVLPFAFNSAHLDYPEGHDRGIPSKPKVIEVSPYRLTLVTADTREIIVRQQQPLDEQIFLAVPWPESIFSIIQEEFDGVKSVVTEIFNLKQDAGDQPPTEGRTLDIKLDQQGILTMDKSNGVLQPLQGPLLFGVVQRKLATLGTTFESFENVKQDAEADQLEFPRNVPKEVESCVTETEESLNEAKVTESFKVLELRDLDATKEVLKCKAIESPSETVD